MVALTDIQLLRICLWGFAVACVGALVLIGLIFGRQEKRLKRELSEKYPLVYRVTSIPSDNQYALTAEGSSIQVGDFGWEAEPLHNDGLVYLHGLNDAWQVVWYVGFRPGQIEAVGPKPRTQYYVFPYWADAEKVAKASPCPFPVKQFQHGKYPTAHFGFPVQIRQNWVQGRCLSTG